MQVFCSLDQGQAAVFYRCFHALFGGGSSGHEHRWAPGEILYASGVQTESCFRLINFDENESSRVCRVRISFGFLALWVGVDSRICVYAGNSRGHDPTYKEAMSTENML